MNIHRSNTLKEDKDEWCTPQWLFDRLNEEFKFYLDACADRYNSLTMTYYCKEHSALENKWNKGPVFMNPPYSQAAKFLERAAEQSAKYGITVVALVNANTDTKWFAKAVETASEVRLLTGRVSFVRPDGTLGKGNSKGQCIIIWKGSQSWIAYSRGFLGKRCYISVVNLKGLVNE